MNHTIEIRRLSECPIDQAVQIWNAGFQGYRVDLTKSRDAYVARLHDEDLSPEFSFIAFVSGQPAGFLLNGIRESAGRKVAWNGGTGVSPEFRGQGIGNTLVATALELYQDQGVELATLEAISDNDRAIALYQKFGYEIIDRLLLLQRDGALLSKFSNQGKTYSIKHVAPANVASLSFYDTSGPWPAQWQNVALRKGQALIASDDRGEDAGYALYTNTLSKDGELSAMTLYQCVASPERDDAEKIAAALLDDVYAPPEADCHRSTFNLSEKNEAALRHLKQAGFVPFIEQVHMVKRLKRRED